MPKRLVLDFNNGHYIEILHSPTKGFIANFYERDNLSLTLTGTALSYEIGYPVEFFNGDDLVHRTQGKVFSSFQIL